MSEQINWQQISVKDGEVLYLPGALAASLAKALLHELYEQIPWQVDHYQIFGKKAEAPRRVAWYGDEGANYRYSGVDHLPLPWTEALSSLRNHVQSLCNEEFNSVLLNLYRDGQDSMGWHADKEPELGRSPAIASVSLGAPRVFKIRHEKSGEIIETLLEPGSLLLMRGEFQHHWKHALPKSKLVNDVRINLTFRNIKNVNK